MQSMHIAIQSLRASGVITVVAAGNSNVPACEFSPAGVPEAVTVAASTDADFRAQFQGGCCSASNYGQCIDIFAPGRNIISLSHRSDVGCQCCHLLAVKLRP